MPPFTNHFPSFISALTHRNYRFYFFGQAVSVLGSWIQQVAMSWLAYRLTGSAALLGVTSCCALIPVLLIGPVAGAWIDKKDKKKWLIGVQGALALQGFTLAVLTWADKVGTGLLVTMSLTLGVLNSIDKPLRQSLICNFVCRREDLTNALALIAVLLNVGRTIGPPIAGVLVGLTSEATCFAINGVSFLILMFILMRINGFETPRAIGSMAEVMSEGVYYAWHTWPVRILIIILIVINLTASTYSVLLPIFASDVFFGDATTLGWLWGAVGCGSFISTIYLATVKSVRSLTLTLINGIIISAISIVLFAVNNAAPMALFALAGVGFGITASNVSINMLLQTIAPDHLRGRIVSFFTSARFGFDAIGGLVAGLVATVLSARHTMLMEGALLVVFLGFVLPRRSRLLVAIIKTHKRAIGASKAAGIKG